MGDYQYYVTYGPNVNCTLALCPVTLSVYEYRPSIAANAVLLALFGLALVLHTVLGFRWRTHVFSISMVCGCLSEIIGYAGRIMLWRNPFSFTGSLIQISEFLHVFALRYRLAKESERCRRSADTVAGLVLTRWLGLVLDIYIMLEIGG